VALSSVIDIDLRDDKFVRFQQQFQKYQGSIYARQR